MFGNRPISNFTSIGAVDSSGPQVDIPGLLAGLPPVATDLATALKEFEPSFLDRNASALAAQQVAADNAAQFAGIAGAYSRFGKGYTDYAINNVPAAPGVTIWDANNPLGLELSGTPPLLLNKFGALDTRPPVGPQLVPSDGVIRESAAVSYLRSSGAFAANAGTIEAQVGPAIQPFVLASIPGGQFALAAQGGYQMGQGYGQYQNGETTSGVLNMVGGVLTVAGSVASTGSFVPRTNDNVVSKLSFDSSLNIVDRSFSTRAGEILAENPIGSASYARLQRQGTDVRFVNDPYMPAMGHFDAYDNSVTVNMLRHTSAEEAASTVVHEATHQNGFYRGIAQNTQFTEYQAFRNESLFMNGARPSLSERLNIWNDVKSLYPDLPQGKYPFGGKR
jgi:hypothetical protein